MQIKRITIILITLLITGSNFINAQIQDSTSINGIDSLLCFKYGFQEGDTLFYRVEAHDSIIVNFDEPLTKTRWQRIKFVVDSINEEKIHMSRTLVDYISEESKGDVKNVRRKSHPWVGKTVQIVFDSSGNRFSQSIEDSTKAYNSPGSAFAPYMIFPLGGKCKFLNESWLVNSVDTVAENGFPFPIIDQTSLFRTVGYLDTLGHEAKRIRYVKTAQGQMYLVTEEQNIYVHSVINSGGKLTLDKKTDIPLHFFATLEIKAKVKYPDGTEQPTKHFTTADYTLDRYLPAKKENDSNGQQEVHGKDR